MNVLEVHDVSVAFAIRGEDRLLALSGIELAMRSGDFVVALYNPASKRRTRQLARAREILLKHRPPATPAMLARNLGREDEAVETVTLSELDPSRADMLTVVIVGSSRTRAFARGGETRVYTPRGYRTKGATSCPSISSARAQALPISSRCAGFA